MSFNDRMHRRAAFFRRLADRRRAFIADLERWEDETGKRHLPLWPALVSPLWAVPLAVRRASYLLQKKTPGKARPETMKRFSSAAQGTPIPRALGRVGKIPGTVIYASDYSSTRSANGNIRPDLVAPASAQSEGQKVYVTAAVLICAGPVDAVTRVWADDTLIYQRGEGFSVGYVDYSDSITLYLGTETQGVDPHLEELEPGLTPAYRGSCYAVFHGFDLSRFNNTLPRFEFEVLESAAPVFNFEQVTLSSLDSDALVASRRTPFLYALGGTTLHAVSRVDLTETYAVDVVDQLDAFSPGASLVGRLCLDDAAPGDAFIFGAQTSGGAGFLMLWSVLSAKSNAANAIPGWEPLEAFGLGANVYVADVSGVVKAFRRSTLTQLWSRPAPDAAAIPGNFSHDAAGRLWLIHRDSGAPSTGPTSRFWLSRYTAGGEVLHTEIAGLGSAKQLAISVQGTQEFALCGGGDSGVIVRVNIEGTPTPTVTEAGLSADAQRSLWLGQYRFRDQRFFSTDGDSLFYLSTEAGGVEVVETVSGSDHGLRVTGPLYDRERDTLYSAEDAPAGVLVAMRLGRVQADSKTLAAVVSDLAQLSGLDGAELDVTALTSTSIEGVLVDDLSTGAEALEAVLETYRVGVAESGGKLVFRSLAPSSPLSVSEDDLGAGAEPEEVLFGEEVEEADEVPLAVEVQYKSRDRDYAEAVQRWQRRADLYPGQTELAFRSPLVLSDETARRLAQVVAQTAERESYRFALALGPKWLRLDPLDALTLPLDADTETVRVESVELGADRTLRVAAVRADAESYASILPGAGADSSEAEVQAPAPSIGLVLDLPALRDADGEAGLYWAAGPLGPGRWLGAQLGQSVDGGASYAPVLVTGDASAFARCVAALAAPSSTGPLFDGSMTLLVLSGSFAAATQAEVLASRTKNLVAVGRPDTAWELLQYTTVTDNGDGTTTLGGLLRGRFGTEHAQATHGDGELVIECDPAKLRRVLLSEDALDTTVLYRTATVNEVPTGAGDPLTIQLLSLKPWAPVTLSAYQLAGATKDAILLWLRRPRIGGGLVDSVDVPAGEEVEEYEVEILDGLGAVKRTLTATMPAPPVVNIAVDGTTQKLTRASGDWGADGIHPGCVVELEGFTDPANSGLFVVAASLSTTEITLSGGASALVTEASASGRTVTRRSPLAVYTQADQITDFGAVVTSVTFRVYQLSAVVGRGYVSETKTQAL